MRQNNVCCSSIIIAREEIRESFIGKVPHPAHNALLDGPGIRPATQHFEIMIGLDNQQIAAAQLIANVRWEAPEIGGDADLAAFRPERESYGFGSIERGGKGCGGELNRWTCAE